MNSNSSPNSTENSRIISESLKERALSLIKDENINEKEITSYSQDLMTIPNLDEDVVNIDSPLLEIDSFEIFSKTNLNPVFVRNLLNIIHIINFIWLASKNKVEIFHRTLLNLGIMFSFLFRNEKDDKAGIDYVLMAPIPNIIYDFIAKNGKGSFKIPNNFDFDEEIFNTDKNETQIGYAYQENSISHILSSLNPKDVKICPKIIYYLRYEKSKYLFKKNIFNNPKNFLDLVHEEIETENEIETHKEFYGYNEIDLSLTLTKDAKINENFTFNIVKEKNSEYISKKFSPPEKGHITFEKNSNIFIELKSSIKNCKVEDTLAQLKKISQRFSQGYKNSAYEPLNKIFSKNKNLYFLFYDDNRIELFNKINPNLTLDKDVEICYNSVNVQLSSIVSLQNQIREIKKESNSQNEKINELQIQINNQNDKINQLLEKIRKDKENNDYNISIMNLKIANTKEESIQNLISASIKKKSISMFSAFRQSNINFTKSIELLEKISPFEEFITMNDNIIGKKEVDINEYKNFINKLDNKIEKKTFGKEYYIAYKKAITGKNYEESNGEKCDFPECDEKIAKVLKNILKFIYLLDRDPLLLNSFHAAILYYTITINDVDNENGKRDVYSRLYLSKFECSNIKDCVIYVIQSINPTYLIDFLAAK